MIAPRPQWNRRFQTPKQPRRRPSKRRRTKLRFSPTAWAKLLFLRDLGPTEIGGFGITSPEDPLLVTEFALLQQTCTPTTVEFDESAIADFVDDQVDLGRSPSECLRLWIHTHPGSCPHPSPTDEATFANVFGDVDWSVMFILASGGATYGRLQANAGPRVVKRLSVSIDFSRPFEAADRAAWQAEYDRCVCCMDPFDIHSPPRRNRLSERPRYRFPDEWETWR